MQNILRRLNGHRSHSLRRRGGGGRRGAGEKEAWCVDRARNEDEGKERLV